MPSLNKVMLIGHLGRDPETRYLSNGNAVTNATLATTESWKKDGQREEKTEWHNLTFYGKVAEIAGQYLKKGAAVYVEGRIETRKWQDKEGKDRYTTQIVVNEMKMLGGKEPKPEPRQQSQKQRSPGNVQDMDDDIPFANPYKGRLAYIV